MNRPRLLLAGLGRMGVHHHGALLRCGRFELLGTCDRDPARLAGSAHPGWTRLEDALEALRPDAVLLALPPASHDQTARLCLEAGAGVLLEKPLTPRLETSRALVAAFSARSLVLQPAMSERFHPAWGRALAILPSLGRLERITVERFGCGERSAHGIDAALDLGIHDLDLLASLAPALEPVAGSREPLRLQLSLEDGKGLAATVDARWNAPFARRQWLLHGSAGTLALDFLNGSAHLDGKPVDVPRHDALEAQLAHFAHALEGQADPGTGSALRAQEWLDSPTKATASISTFTSRGRFPTSMVERAGA